jgi:SpoVK/Ycf46/Vps4 family AAA+-type ATPase
LDAISIESIAKSVLGLRKRNESRNKDPDMQNIRALLLQSFNQIIKTRFGDLAEEIESIATLNDIILPDRKKEMLNLIATHFRHRDKVYHEWDFAKKSNRSLGIIALFAGESGTGKTMAAEAIANELDLDLYRVDLFMVTSKYIGETEKNIRRIFDAAESKEYVLFFDEADSLFGKRSEVRDSHDRYANIQVGYLSQRIESFEGIVILATNLKRNLDPAFMRRIRFIIDFPFPDEASREKIWQAAFPVNSPKKMIDFAFLSHLSMTGEHSQYSSECCISCGIRK